MSRLAEPGRISRDDVEEILPLLPGQQTLFLTLPESGVTTSLEQRVWTLHGRLDTERLQRALNHLSARHPVLRTVFFRARKQPVQLVLKSLPVSLAVADLRNLAPEAGLAESERLLGADLQRGVEAFRGPLLHARLLRLGDEEARLVLSYHPLILDGPSLPLLAADLLAVYAALEGDRALPAAEARSPLKSWLLWSKRQGAEKPLDFWVSHLDGFENPTPLPVDRCPAAEESCRPGLWRGSLSAAASRRLEALSQEWQMSPGTWAQAAWALLLARFSGEDDVVFGLTVSGRQIDLEGVERMIGPFANPVPARVGIEERKTLGELLHSVVQQNLSFNHTSHVPLADVRSKSRLEPPLKLYASHLSFHDETSPVDTASSLRCRRLLPCDGSERLGLGDVDLAVDVWSGEPWCVELAYDRQVFDQHTGEQLAASFVCLLENMAANPQSRLADLGMLAPAQWERLRPEIDRRAQAHALGTLVPEVFAARVRERPEAVALTHGEQSLSYGELHAQSNRLARHLSAHGVGRESCVGIFGERSLGMMATVLGTLKAGAAWVPLEPAHPDERLARILATSGVAMVATQWELVSRLPSLTGKIALAPAIYCWDAAPAGACFAGAASLAGKSAAKPASASHPQDLANVFYTSGSTGVPKGVMVEHGGMMNHLWAKVDVAGLDADSVVAQNASHCFDIFVWQLLAALLVGGRVVIVNQATAFDPALLLTALERHGVTVLETVPSLLEMLLERVAERRSAGEAARLPALRLLISNAETLPVPLSRRWLELFPEVPIVNTYGATECSDDTTHLVFRTPPSSASPRMAVGQPIRGFAIYVLDATLRALPPGCPGQIAMAGVGVGRGYLGAPAATATIFVPHPFAGGAGLRLYLTRDLGRLKGDGVLEFLGRIDNQVKVRGHRIELGEVEAALGRHPALRQVATMVRQKDGTHRLVAYVVADEPLDVAGLRAFLEGSLPAYMVPEQFVRLGAMPLNRNGKIDRKALPEPPTTAPREDLVVPRNELEAIIADIWQEVLGLPRVSVEDNFFELGGHSLLAIQVRSRINHRLGVELPLRSVLGRPRLEDLAREIRSFLAESGRTEVASIPRIADRPEYPLSYSQRGLWLVQQLDPGNTALNLPAPLLLEGSLNVPALDEAITSLVRRHEALRTCFDWSGGEPVQRIEETFGPPVRKLDLSELPDGQRDEQLAAVVDETLRTPFDLEKPPFRSLLVTLEARRHLLFLALHHLISDGSSGQVLLRDLLAFYRGACRGEAPRLPALPIRYVDYAAWQAKRAADGELEEAERFWLDHLAGGLPVLELPADHPAPSKPQAPARAELIELGAALVEQIRRIAKAHGATLFMVQLALLDAFLHRLTGERELLVGTPVANREHPDTEGLIGLLINTMVLRTEIGSRSGFSGLLERVRQTALRAYPHQHYPFDLLVERLNLRGANGSAAFQVLFMTAPARRRQWEMDGLRVQPVMDLVDVPDRQSAGDRRFWTDLSLFSAEEQDGHLTWSVFWNGDRFEAGTARRLTEQLRILIHRIVEAPEVPLAELDLLSSAERDRVLREFNRNPKTFPLGRFAHQLFEDHAHGHPNAPAVAFQETILTYGELNSRANRMAHWLRREGVGSECRVGLLGHRGPGMLVAILAILKAGAAWVPLDPKHPDTRLAKVLESVGLDRLATQSDMAARCLAQAAAAPSSFEVFCWDEAPSTPRLPGPEDFAAFPATDPPTRIRPHGLAYVFYTSGSTGTPQGAMVEHLGMVNHLWSKIDLLGLDRDSVVAQNASHCFDISVWQLLAALAVGGRVLVYDDETALDPLRLLEAVERDGVTVLETVPSLLESMLQALALTDEQDELRTPPGRLAWVLSTGEALPVAVCRRWLERFPTIPVVNAYGPTECSDDVTHHVIDVPPEEREVRIPVGRPLPGLRMYVLDRDLQPVPAEALGQVAVAGVGVGRGYLDNAVKTAQVFVPDPFGDDAAADGGRLYLAGDLGRWRADGVLDFLGRIDHQVKVRGFRIELGEIETALGRHPRVREAIVLVREQGVDRVLVAYVVPTAPSGGAPTRREPRGLEHSLRQFLREHLPPYMVPDAVVELDAMPLNRNGKIDRRALPVPDLSRIESDFVGPRDALELEVARLWEEELNIEAVGVFDSFFDQGGQSLKAVTLAARLRRRFEIELPIHSFLENPTVDGVSQQIRRAVSENPGISAASESLLVELHAGGPGVRPLFLVHPGGGTVLCYYTLARSLGAEQGVYGLRSQGLEEGEETLESVQEMAVRYRKEIQRIQPEGPYRLAGWSLGGVIAFEMTRQWEAEDVRVELLAMLDAELWTPERLPFGAAEATVDRLLPSFAKVLFGVGEDRFEDLTEEQALDLFASAGQSAGRLPTGLERETVLRLVTVMAANNRALARYRPEGPVRVGIQLFRAAEDSLVGGREVWTPWVQGPVRELTISGNHYELVYPPAVHGLAEALRGLLAEPPAGLPGATAIIDSSIHRQWSRSP